MAKTKMIMTTLLITTIFLAVLFATPVMAIPITVAISPTSGTVGSTVTVSGTGATASGEVRAYWGDAFMATTTANATGGYSVNIIVPDHRAGPMDIWVRDVTTGNADRATFAVEPKIVLIPDKGSAWYGGDQITVVGTGFGIHEFPPPQEPWWAPCNVTLEFNGIVWTNITSTDWDGSFEAGFYVPDTMPSGTYTVNATDDLGNSASAPALSSPSPIFLSLNLAITASSWDTESLLKSTTTSKASARLIMLSNHHSSGCSLNGGVSMSCI